jgi:MFS family permease
MAISTTIAGLSTLFIWGCTQNYWVLSFYVLIYGAISGGIQVLRSRFATATVGKDDEPSALIVYGILTATRGVGMIMSGFIGAVLVDETVQFDGSYGAGKWRNIIVFIGLTMTLVGCTIIARWCKQP